MILSQGQINQLNPDRIREEAQELWELCFEDSPEFIAFYFGKVFKPEEAYIAHSADGQAIAHIHAKRYPFSLGTPRQANLEPSALPQGFYVSGACTRPEHRGQGIMRDLMIHTMQAEAMQGRILAFLIPADNELRSYYKKHFGFMTNNYLHSTNSPESASLDYEADSSQGSAYSSVVDFLYHTEQGKAQAGIRRERADWANICTEYEISPQASIEVYREEASENILACALIRLTERRVFVDGIFGTPTYRRRLLQRVQSAYPQYELRIVLSQASSEQNQTTPRAMIRPLRFDIFLLEYQHLYPNEEVKFSLLDEILPQNTGDYCITQGEVSFTAGKTEYPQMSIPEFVTRFIPEYEMRFLHE